MRLRGTLQGARPAVAARLNSSFTVAQAAAQSLTDVSGGDQVRGSRREGSSDNLSDTIPDDRAGDLQRIRRAASQRS